MTENNSRRDFIKNAALIGAGLGFVSLGSTALKDMVIHPFRPIPHGNAAPLSLKDADGLKMKVVHTVCLGCNARCGLRARVYDNIVYKVDGNPYCMANNYWEGKDMETPLGESFKFSGKTCLKGQEIAHYAYDPYRVITPLKRTGKRGEGKFKPITWDQLIEETTNGSKIDETGEALTGFKDYADHYLDEEKVVEAVLHHVSSEYLNQWANAMGLSGTSNMKEVVEKNIIALYLSEAEAAKLPADIRSHLLDPQMPGLGPKSNLFSFMAGRGTEGRGELLKRFAYETIGSPNVIGHADVCQWPKWAGQICAYDEPHVGPDLKSTEYVISWGAQIAESFNPAVPTWGLMHERKGRGDLKVVWIDPRAHNGVNAYSHRHIMPKPGEDGAIATAMLSWMLNNGKYDQTFLENPNQKAAEADDEVMFSNASHLVVIGPKNHKLYRRMLRADAAGVGSGDDYVVVDKGSKSIKAASASSSAYILMDDYSGAVRVNNELYSQEDNDPSMVYPKKSKGVSVRLSDGSTVNVTTSLQLIKDFVSATPIEEWAKRAKVKASDIIKTAEEFASYGKKGCIVSYRGAVMHINGVPTAWLIEALNMLNGNIGHKGGMIWKAGTGDTEGDAYDFGKDRHGWGARIIRTQLNYDESPFYAKSVMEGKNPYPAMMPWYKIVGPHYHCAGYMPSIGHNYPYDSEKAQLPFALMTYLSNPLYSYPVANEYKEVLLDTKRMGLHVSISNTVDDTGYFADYIVPDITYAEGFTGVQALYHFFFYNAIRSAVIEPLTDPIGDGRSMMYETFLVDVGQKLGSPMWGKGAFKGKGKNAGKSMDFFRAEDFQMKQIANLVLSLESKGYKLEPTAEDIVFVEKNYPMVKHYKAALSEAEWPKVAYLLSRGGFFVNYEEHFNEKDQYSIKPLNKTGMVRFYYEDAATRKNPMTGKYTPGHPRYVSLKEAGSWQGYDPDKQELSHPLKMTTYKSALHTQSRTMSYMWAHESMPENELWMNPADAEKLGLVKGDMVKVRSVGKETWGISINGNDISFQIKLYVTNRIKQGVTAISGNFGHWCTTGQYKVPLTIANADSVMLGAKNKTLFGHWKMEQLQGKALKVNDGDSILSDKRRDKGAPFITAYQSITLASGVKYPLTDIYGCGVAFYDNNIQVEKA